MKQITEVDEVLERATQGTPIAPDQTFCLLESYVAGELRYRNAGEAVDELRKLTWEIAGNIPATIDGTIATLKYLGRVGPDGGSQDYYELDSAATPLASHCVRLEPANDSTYPLSGLEDPLSERSLLAAAEAASKYLPSTRPAQTPWCACPAATHPSR